MADPTPSDNSMRHIVREKSRKIWKKRRKRSPLPIGDRSQVRETILNKLIIIRFLHQRNNQSKLLIDLKDT
jgi:hypothetical protein